MTTNPKDIVFQEEAREKLLAGIAQLTDIVKFTLGPKGRNVTMEKSWGAPNVTNDGSSIAKEINLEDSFEDMGANMAKEVVSSLKDKCGDGTTRATLLFHALVEYGVKNIASGASPISLKRGIDKATQAVVAAIDAAAQPISNIEDTQRIATASASGNTEVGTMIAQAMEKVGTSGVITIEEAKGTETTLDTVDGMQFDRGYVSAYFCTNTDKMSVEMQDVKFLIVDKKISSIQEILPILQSVSSSAAQLVIIADDIEGDALSTLVVNKIRGTLKIAAIKAPGFGDRRKAMLQDIAILTGGTVISEDTGMSLNTAQFDALGSAEKVTITKDKTTIVNGHGTADGINGRIAQIENEMQTTASSYDKDKLNERKAKLSGGVAVIRVGASTEPEMKHKKQLFEDSLNSTKAAQEEGTVTGGGTTLLAARNVIKNLGLSGDEALGAEIVYNACAIPCKQLAMNAGFEGAVILSQLERGDKNLGFNCITGQLEDMTAAGIIDPAKVVKNCITYAASSAGVVLLSEALITDAKDDDE